MNLHIFPLQGQFNIIAPPTPPAKSPKFQYLPAIYPPNETQRIALSRSYNCKWSQLIEAKAGFLIGAAMKKFETRFASLSFFDETHERFRAENGYGQKDIARAISIGAHALYSSDVLVVLDTAQVCCLSQVTSSKLIVIGLALPKQPLGHWKS
jgi:hypothetical protein